MKRKKVSTYSSNTSHQAMREQMADDLGWYNATPYAHLTVAVFLAPGACQRWAMIEDILSTFRAGKTRQKSDPQFRFFVDPGVEIEVYERLEKLDTRLPRLSVCPVVATCATTVMPNIPNIPDIHDQLRSLSEVLAGRLLDCRLAFLPDDADGVACVSRILEEVEGVPALRALFANFPLVEVGFATAGSSERDEPGAQLEAAVAALWERYPRLVESINASVGGYVRRFYYLKEAWHLSHITGRARREPASIGGSDEQAAARVAEFDAAFYATHASPAWYASCRHKKASSILEFDLDSIADTYECQSPVFVDGRWILDRDRLAGQNDPVAVRIAQQATGSGPIVVEPAAVESAAVESAAEPVTEPAARGPRRVSLPLLSKKTDVVLLKMPNHNMDYPHLAIPTITAALRNANYTVVQQDVNVQLRDMLLTAAHLRELTATYLPALGEEFLDAPTEFERIRNAFAYLCYVDDNIGFERVEQVKRRMQAREYEALFCHPDDASVVNLIFVLTGMMHVVIDLALTADEMGVVMDNPVIRFLDKKVKEVSAMAPRIVGFSVIQIQRKATLWFAKRLKQTWDGLVVIGGPDPSTFKQEYLAGNTCIDVCFLKEAEGTFLEFLAGKSPKEIDGIVYRGEDGAICTNESNYDKKNSVFRPDFDGFDLDKFLLPTLPLSTSRGCSFAKCTFCNHYKTYSGYYSNDAIKTVDTLEFLAKRHNTRFFHFVDDMLEVETGTLIAEEIIRRGLDVNIITYARFEAPFFRDTTILEKWQEAGIRVIEWGLESASQRVLNLMIKGVSIKKVQGILDISSSKGIVNKLMLFHNYPGETVEDLRMTVDFLHKNVVEKKVRPFFTVRGRLELRLFTPLEMDSREPEKDPFRKRYERSSSFDSLLGYADEDDYPEKSSYIEKFIDKMSSYLLERNIFSTNDENMSLDLIVLDMKRRGLQPAMHCQ
jgi:anaerobic magnesium-protoporphyrin IX monomethyl ester cyclase